MESLAFCRQQNCTQLAESGSFCALHFTLSVPTVALKVTLGFTFTDIVLYFFFFFFFFFKYCGFLFSGCFCFLFLGACYLCMLLFQLLLLLLLLLLLKLLLLKLTQLVTFRATVCSYRSVYFLLEFSRV